MRLGDLDALKEKIQEIVETEMPIDEKMGNGFEVFPIRKTIADTVEQI